MKAYSVNEGYRDRAIRLGCEQGVYDFIKDYSDEMGMSMSGALRRLALIGARCESEHGKRPMPVSYESVKLTTSKETEPEKECDWDEN